MSQKKSVSASGVLYALEPFMTHVGKIESAGFVASDYTMRNAVETQLETNQSFIFGQKAIGILFRLEAEGPFELRTPKAVLRSTPVCGRPTHVIHFAHGCPVGVLRYHKCEIASTAAESVSVLCYSLNPVESKNIFPDFSGFMWSPVTSSKSGRFQVLGTSAQDHSLMFAYGTEKTDEQRTEKAAEETAAETTSTTEENEAAQ